MPAPPAEATAQALLLAWYDQTARDLPWRRTRDPYAILVSEVMLQQTQVDRVIPKYHEFLDRFPSLASLASASPAEVIRAWSPLGYNRRAVHLHRLAAHVVQHHGGRLPSDMATLRRLPGIGPYTAAAVRCFAFGEAEAVVDTNVRRVLVRLQPEHAKSESAVRLLASRYLPPERAADWNQALMDLGATVCRAAAPLCLLCPLRDVCPSRGRRVRETREQYASRAPREPFRSTDRFLRGRIVDALRKTGTLSTAELATALELEGARQQARLAALLQALERDGLITTRGLGSAHSLPDQPRNT